MVILRKRISHAVFSLNSELRQLIGMENNKLMGALIWCAFTTLPTPVAILLLLTMRFPLSLTTTGVEEQVRQTRQLPDQ